MRTLLLAIPMIMVSACSVEPAAVTVADGREMGANRYATNFKILRTDDSRTLVIFGPGGVEDTVSVFVVPNGEAPERVIVSTTTHLPFIKALGKEDKVVGAVHTREIVDEGLRARVADGRIMEVGTADGWDFEKIISLRPQLILDNPFGKDVRSGRGDISLVHITEYLEEHPLGRAEWPRVFGLLLNAEQFADSLFAAIEARYHTIAGMPVVGEQRPKVFFGSAWQGQWFAPPANSYMATLIKDSGAEYKFADRNDGGNITLDLEGVMHKVRRCDHFGVILSHQGEVTAEVITGGEIRLSTIPAVAHGGFYGNSAQHDLFGQALLEPDRILTDLRTIFHGGGNDSAETVYFHRIAADHDTAVPQGR